MLDHGKNSKICNTLGEKMKITNEILEQVYAIFGDCQIELDNDGQIIIYTGLYEKEEEEE